MSYANMDSVPTQSAGVSEVLASDWNTYVRDNFDAIKAGHVVVTSTQKNALIGVTTGTMVYDSTLGVFQSYNGSAWVNAQGTPPSLTTTQKNALGTPATGTMVYDATIGVAQVWNGTSWVTPFPYLYSTETFLLQVNSTSTKDILWPADFRNVFLETDIINSGTQPNVTWRFLQNGSELTTSVYNHTNATLGATYSASVVTSANQVNFFYVGVMNHWTFTLPDASVGLRYPAYNFRSIPQNQVGGGLYSSNAAPTGIRLTVTGSPTANITLRCRVLVQS